jgi:trigger factor
MNIDLSKIKVKKSQADNCKVNLFLEIDESTVKNAFDNALVQTHAGAQMPGFRTGKVPLNIIKENFKDQIKDRALETIIKNSLSSVLENEKINPVSTPVIRKIDYKENKPLKLEAQIEVPPKIEPKNYEKINILKRPSKVTDEMTEKELQNLRRRNMRLEAEEENIQVGENHYVVVDYKAFQAEQQLSQHSATGEIVDMASPQTIKGLAENIKDAKKGETRQFETEIEGKKITFKVTINEIKKKILPELNDEFAKEMNFETLEKLKIHIRNFLYENLKNQAKQKTVKQIEDHLLKHNDFELPESLVEQNMDLQLQKILGQTGGQKLEVPEAQKKEYKEKLRRPIERDLRLAYILHAISEKENIKTTKEELEKELQTGLTKARTDKEKQHLKEFFNSKKQHILLALTERKVFDFLESKAKVTEAWK